MTWRVLIRGPAEADLEQARSWYDGQRAGLGDEFLVSIAEAFTRLEQDPGRYRILYKGFRRVLVERFPYRIFYQVKARNVIVFRKDSAFAQALFPWWEQRVHTLPCKKQKRERIPYGWS